MLVCPGAQAGRARCAEGALPPEPARDGEHWRRRDPRARAPPHRPTIAAAQAEEGDLHSLYRALDTSVFLCVRKSRQHHAWQFPMRPIEEGESARAVRARPARSGPFCRSPTPRHTGFARTSGGAARHPPQAHGQGPECDDARQHALRALQVRLPRGVPEEARHVRLQGAGASHRPSGHACAHDPSPPPSSQVFFYRASHLWGNAQLRYPRYKDWAWMTRAQLQENLDASLFQAVEPVLF